jgi:hypothetical protein
MRGEEYDRDDDDNDNNNTRNEYLIVNKIRDTKKKKEQ